MGVAGDGGRSEGREKEEGKGRKTGVDSKVDSEE